MIDDVITRIEAQVPALVGRTNGAADLMQLMKENRLPQHPVAAHVLPGGLRGGGGESAANAYTQMVDEVISIILTFRIVGPTAERVLPELEAIIRNLAQALMGWSPSDTVGVFGLRRGSVVKMEAGTLIYQLDFAISDQWRVIS